MWRSPRVEAALPRTTHSTFHPWHSDFAFRLFTRMALMASTTSSFCAAVRGSFGSSLISMETRETPDFPEPLDTTLTSATSSGMCRTVTAVGRAQDRVAQTLPEAFRTSYQDSTVLLGRVCLYRGQKGGWVWLNVTPTEATGGRSAPPTQTPPVPP